MPRPAFGKLGPRRVRPRIAAFWHKQSLYAILAHEWQETVVRKDTFAPFRRQGYATEACAALMDWAQQQGVTRFILSISPQNEPSLRIAAHFGFVKVGSQIDEEDGIEDIYERRFILCEK